MSNLTINNIQFKNWSIKDEHWNNKDISTKYFKVIWNKFQAFFEENLNFWTKEFYSSEIIDSNIDFEAKFYNSKRELFKLWNKDIFTQNDLREAKLKFNFKLILFIESSDWDSYALTCSMTNWKELSNFFFQNQNKANTNFKIWSKEVETPKYSFFVLDFQKWDNDFETKITNKNIDQYCIEHNENLDNPKKEEVKIETTPTPSGFDFSQLT